MANHADSPDALNSSADSSDAVPGNRIDTAQGVATTSQPSKTPIIIALILALLLVAGVLIGTRIMYQRIADTPIAMSTIEAPEADSAQCAAYVAALPEEFAGLDRANLADPAPAGAAAWHNTQGAEITTRCGVYAPLQYTQFHGPLVEAGGTSWLQVRDTTVGVEAATWYAVGSSPLVAITVQDDYATSTPNFDELADALATLDNTAQETYAAGIAELAVTESSQCAALLDALPQTIGSEPEYQRVATDLSQTAVYAADGYESVVVRCGVGFPEHYEAGMQVQQVNDVPWIEDTALGNGTTASVWYALGYEEVVVASIPQASGNPVLTTLSNAIADTIPAE